MNKERIHIRHPFLTVEDFRQRAGAKLAGLIHRLVGRYPQLQESCGMQRMLLALSVAWGMSDMAQAGNIAAFDHIDEALQPYQRLGYAFEPPGGCVVVEGQPFLIAEHEEGMGRFLWDGFAIIIEFEDKGNIAQAFFDLADSHQWKAYDVMGEAFREETLGARQNKKNNQQQISQEEKEKEEREKTNKEIEEIEETEETKETKKAEETNIGNKNDISNSNEEKDIERLGTADMEPTAVADIGPTAVAGMEQTENVDGLAELVDIMLSSSNSIEELEHFSTMLDRYCVEATGAAHLVLTAQARRLHYLIDRKRQEAKEDEQKRRLASELALKQQIEQLKQLIIEKKGNITMGDSYTISVQGDYVHGDKVMGNKYVGAACQQGEQEEHIKNALSILMDEKAADGKPLFQTQAQWFAVYRILTDDYGWKDGALSEFCRRINQLGAEWRVPCKLEGIKKVNQTPPFYKPFSEWKPEGNRTTYDRQQQVALRFQQLMQEEMG